MLDNGTEQAKRRNMAQMNKNLLILGAGQYGQVAKEIADDMKCFEKIAFLDDKFGENTDQNELIIGNLSDYEKFVTEYSYAFVAIGSAELRLEYIKKLQDECFNVVTLVSPKAYVSQSAQIMCGSIVEAMAVVNAKVSIAIGVYVCAGAIVNHNSFVGDGCTLQCGSTVPANSLVLAKTTLGYNEVYTKRFDEPIEKRTPVGNDYKFEDGM